MDNFHEIVGKCTFSEIMSQVMILGIVGWIFFKASRPLVTSHLIYTPLTKIAII